MEGSVVVDPAAFAGGGTQSRGHRRDGGRRRTQNGEWPLGVWPLAIYQGSSGFPLPIANPFVPSGIFGFLFITCLSSLSPDTSPFSLLTTDEAEAHDA